MKRVEWLIDGVEFSNCNCNYACPCQFESLPTGGDCKGFGVMRIDRGHFGDITLDGLLAAMIFAWPGAIFEGGGEMQVIIDERADARQREAIDTIMHGGEVAEAGNHWWVFNAMCDTRHETLYKPIAFEVDIEARAARVSIPGVLGGKGMPIRSPVTGDDHRVRIDLPDGIEFKRAEIGSGSGSTQGAIAMTLNDSYGQFNRLHHNQHGIAS